MTFIVDGTSGLTFPNSTVQASAGKLIQVVSVNYSTTVTIATQTWTNSGLSLSITPKFSTSKLLVMVNANGLGKDTNNTWNWLRVMRDGSVSQVITNFAGYTASSAALTYGSACIHYLDNATTTSSTTYSLQLASGAGITNAYLNIAGTENSSITIMEIAA